MLNNINTYKSLYNPAFKSYLEITKKHPEGKPGSPIMAAKTLEQATKDLKETIIYDEEQQQYEAVTNKGDKIIFKDYDPLGCSYFPGKIIVKNDKSEKVIVPERTVEETAAKKLADKMNPNSKKETYVDDAEEEFIAPKTAPGVSLSMEQAKKEIKEVQDIFNKTSSKKGGSRKIQNSEKYGKLTVSKNIDENVKDSLFNPDNQYNELLKKLEWEERYEELCNDPKIRRLENRNRTRNKKRG